VNVQDLQKKFEALTPDITWALEELRLTQVIADRRLLELKRLQARIDELENRLRKKRGRVKRILSRVF